MHIQESLLIMAVKRPKNKENNMEIKAKAKYIKVSSRKTRLVVDVIRGLEVQKALEQLRFINKKVTEPITKLVNSVVANAENNFELEKDNLFIKEIRVDEGPTLKRWKPRARGRATPIRKRTCHIGIILGEIKDSGKVKAKKQKIDAPIKLGEKDNKDKKVSLVNKSKEKNTKIESKDTKKGFAEKIFRRKSG